MSKKRTLMDKRNEAVGGSFRDPSGFLFRHAGELYRQVNLSGREDYEHFVDSGLYDHLVKDGLLVPHEEVSVPTPRPDLLFKVIRPEPIAFISYPYEWSFSQLKDAALTTLQIQKRALEYGMSLKDASAYNVQFHHGHPVLIDTLSFQIYQEGKPWDAYRQFCQHFLAPLALMAYRDVELGRLLRVYIDGIPLPLAQKLLPFRTRFNFPLLLHLHFHARSQRRYADKAVSRTASARQMSRTAFLGLIDNLESALHRLQWRDRSTAWGDYYDATNYSTAAMRHKETLVAQFISKSAPQVVWDLGANVGRFSRIAMEAGTLVVAFDVDPGAVEQNYQVVKQDEESELLPLVMDLTNPSPALGWQHEERMSLIERGPTDLVIALALVHHLAISNNVPLPQLAGFFRRLGHWLIVEFVPKEDSQVQHLLASREDIFPGYTREGFEEAFAEHFSILAAEAVEDSHRWLYLMQAKP